MKMNAKVFCFVVLAIVASLKVAQAQQQPTIDSLLKDLTSNDREVVNNAALKLAEIGEPAVPRVFAFIRSENDEAKALYDKALEAVQQAEPGTAQGYLRDGSEHDKNIQTALLAVGQIGAPSVPPLLQLFKSENRLRGVAAEALGRTGDKRAIEPLIRTMIDEDTEKALRKEIGEALVKITGRGFGEDAERWRVWWNKNPTKTSRLMSKPPSLLHRMAKIIDANRIYSGINETNCLTWPSPEIKKLGGSAAWGSFAPKNGDRGIVVGETVHCDTGLKMYILKVDRYYVAITSKGLKQL